MKDATDNPTARSAGTRDEAVHVTRTLRGWWRRLFRQRNGADLRNTIEELIDEQEETGEVPAAPIARSAVCISDATRSVSTCK